MRLCGFLVPFLLSACATIGNTLSNDHSFAPNEKAKARIVLGLTYLKHGNMLKARQNLEKALEHAPNDESAQLSLAHYYEQVGENAMAKQLYQTALTAHPDNGNVLNNYGTFLCKQGHYEDAVHYFTLAVNQAYYFLISSSYENAALCSLKAGKLRQAKLYFVRALAHDPNRAGSLLHLARLEIKDREFSNARMRLLKFHKYYGPKRTSLTLLIELESATGNTPLAQKYRTQLAELS